MKTKTARPQYHKVAELAATLPPPMFYVQYLAERKLREITDVLFSLTQAQRLLIADMSTDQLARLIVEPHHDDPELERLSDALAFAALQCQRGTALLDRFIYVDGGFYFRTNRRCEIIHPRTRALHAILIMLAFDDAIGAAHVEGLRKAAVDLAERRTVALSRVLQIDGLTAAGLMI